MRARRTILLTSFGGFPGAPVNPSQAVAALALQFARGRLQRLGIDLVCENLPVVFALTGPTLSALFAQHRPQAVLHLGLAASRRAVTPESRALNRLTLRHADARDQRSKGNAVLPGGAAILPASLSAARRTRVLRASGLPPPCRAARATISAIRHCT